MRTKFTLIFFLLMVATGHAQQYHFNIYSVEEGLPQSEVSDIIQTADGNLWLATGGAGICSFNGKEFTVFDKQSGLADNEINRLAIDNDGILWVATEGGLSRYDGPTNG